MGCGVLGSADDLDLGHQNHAGLVRVVDEAYPALDRGVGVRLDDEADGAAFEEVGRLAFFMPRSSAIEAPPSTGIWDFLAGQGVECEPDS